MRFTDLAVQRLKATGKRAYYQDSRYTGLYLCVGPGGRKSWGLRYKRQGKTIRHTFGQYPVMSLQAATQEHERLAAMVRAGDDPRASEKAHKAQTAARSVNALFATYSAERRQSTSRRTWQEEARLVRHDFLESFGEKPVASVTRAEIKALLAGVKRRAPVVANRLRTALVQLFDYALDEEWIETNPVATVKKPLATERPRERVLSETEIRAFWTRMDSAPTMRAMIIAIKLVLATGQRPGEVAGMRWDELDLEAGLWRLPARRRKIALANDIPLPALAMGLIREMSQTAPHVFPGPFEGHLRESTMPMALKRSLPILGLDPFTPHDLRRTFRTQLASNGIPGFVCERLLGHKMPGVMAVYDRYDYTKEKRDAMARWNDRLTSLIAGKTPVVVPLRSA